MSRMHWACNLAGAVLLSLLLFKVVESAAVVKVRFLSYVNNRGLQYNGHKCDPAYFFHKSPCDPYFTITVSVGGEEFRVKTDRARDQNSVHFGSRIVNINNPLVYRVTNYDRRLKIAVQVDDFDSVGSHDYMGTFRRSFVESARPFGDQTEPAKIRLIDNGRAGAELRLQISVQCEAHYYGPECGKFCRPTAHPDLGHYGCSWNGEKICEPTYDPNTECRVTFCQNTPCQNGGTCRNLHGGFVCACTPGFGGERCTVPIAACQHSRPCQNGGTCQPGVGCTCPTGFHGDACQLDVDECRISAPCRGNGSVCINEFGTYSCQCGAGWSGRNCIEDIDECAITIPMTCFNGGRCENTPGSFNCHCRLGFRGKFCQEDINECAIQVTQGGPFISPCHGTDSVCEDLIGNYSCICGLGWRGRNCTEDINECAGEYTQLDLVENNSTVCLNGGTCENSPGGFSCQCPPGFSGELCQVDIDECSIAAVADGERRSPCHGDGSICENLTGNYSCICGPGWRGRNCTEDINECEQKNSTTICFNGGICENRAGGFTCRCKRGFRGDRCQRDIDECQEGDGSCLNETQVCENLLGSFNCRCRDGWTGPNCTSPTDGPLELRNQVSTWRMPLVGFLLAFVVTLLVSLTVLLLLIHLKPSVRQLLSNWRLRRSSDTTSVYKSSTEADNPVYECEEESGDVAGVSSVIIYDVPGPSNSSIRGENRRSAIPPQLPPRMPMGLTDGLSYQQILPNGSTVTATGGGYVEPNGAGDSAYFG